MSQINKIQTLKKEYIKQSKKLCELKNEIQNIIELSDKKVEYLRKLNKNNDNDMAYGGYRELEQIANRLEALLK